MMYLTLSKHKAAYIRQLAIKKYRLQTHAFVVEGKKSVKTLLESDYQIKFIVASPSFCAKNVTFCASLPKEIDCFTADGSWLSSLGTLEANQDILAVVAMPSGRAPVLTSGITLALDDIRDPGNFGTIIRIADWYGIQTILCSTSTVELYNPKVIQASMGSFAKVKVHYVELADYLTMINLPILGATLSGTSLYRYCFPTDGILVIGNEAHGIDPRVRKRLTETVTIPRYGNAESLNAAIATAVLCDNWKRQYIPSTFENHHKKPALVETATIL